MTEDLRQQIRNARVRAQQFQDAARAHLRKVYRSGQSNGYGSFKPQWGAYGDRATDPNTTAAMGGFAMDYGAEPTDNDVQRFIQSTGGNPALNEIAKLTDQANAPSTTSGATRSLRNRLQQAADKQQSLLDQFTADIKSEKKRANDANQGRFDRLVDPQTGIYYDALNKRQALADNFGIAASADIAQSLKEGMGGIVADQAGRGLANSTNTAANAARLQKNTAAEQQRVRETRDFRKADMLAQDTGTIGGVIERRNDIAPNIGDYLPMILAYGRSNNGQGFDDAALQQAASGGQRYQPAQQAPPLIYGGGYGGSPYVGGVNPVQFAQNYLGNVTGGFGNQQPAYGGNGGDYGDNGDSFPPPVSAQPFGGRNHAGYEGKLSSGPRWDGDTYYAADGTRFTRDQYNQARSNARPVF